MQPYLVIVSMRAVYLLPTRYINELRRNTDAKAEVPTYTYVHGKMLHKVI